MNEPLYPSLYQINTRVWLTALGRTPRPRRNAGRRLRRHAWTGSDGAKRLVVVNYAPNQSQCYVRFADATLTGIVRLRDLMEPVRYERVGSDVNERGLYLDRPPWGYHVFDVATASSNVARVRQPEPVASPT